ncbi:DUF6463 family protein [Actinomadura litoris]|uniref:Uncharacterized protein n=1 Tax=Actinomadura litoris TaxID=2678616 RepID=A0A7K1KXF7_9ACTN|nr:DUF6463 family protein [Actinomadura litoris]MUN36743.1 hypothetical protein [Actinomadura litoris]
MDNLTRWTIRLILATAVGHVLFAFVQPNAWDDIARDGFFRALADDGAAGFVERESSVWFLLAAPMLLLAGLLSRSVAVRTGRMPAETGWVMLLLGVVLVALYFPAGGGWLLLVIGALSLTSAYRAHSPAPMVSAGRGAIASRAGSAVATSASTPAQPRTPR